MGEEGLASIHPSKDQNLNLHPQKKIHLREPGASQPIIILDHDDHDDVVDCRFSNSVLTRIPSLSEIGNELFKEKEKQIWW
jgi:hypothetical protein